MPYWRDYWEGFTDGGHRSPTEEFLAKEAREKLLHLDGGESLLDFGCGAAELLVFFARAYRVAVGVDMSESMLESARDRLESQSDARHVTLIHAEEATVWGKLPPGAFDRITTVEVVQYFTPDQLDHFVHEAAGRLAEGGKLILFDVIDPRLVWLHRIRYLGKTTEPQPSWFRIVRRAWRVRRQAAARRRKGQPPYEMGYAHHPAAVEEIAARSGLDMEYVTSTYYNYRYHAILTHSTRPKDTESSE